MTLFDVYNPLADISPRFTEEELNVIIEWFEENAKPNLILNDAEPINVITVEQLQGFLEMKKFHRRRLHYPSYAEIMTLTEKLKAGVTKVLTKDQLIYMLDKWVLEPNLKHELILAFKVFDTEKRNFLDIEEIQAIVNGYGDVFDESETIEMVRDANVRGDGNIFYEDFVDSMFSLAPELSEITPKFLYDDPDEDPSVPPEPVVMVEESPLENKIQASKQKLKPKAPKSAAKGKKGKEKK